MTTPPTPAPVPPPTPPVPPATVHDPKSFDFAQSVSQQILTLAAAITTITLTFFKDIAPNPSSAAKGVLIFSWGGFALSVGFGILTLMALTGVLARPTSDGVYSGGVRLMAAIQIVLFFVGLVLTVVAGAMAI